MVRRLRTVLRDSIRDHARQCVSNLLREAEMENSVDGKFEQSRFALECMPLSTGEFALAMNRLKNAEMYLQSGEPGAARYELRMLLRSLTNEPSF